VGYSGDRVRNHILKEVQRRYDRNVKEVRTGQTHARTD
jgi:hypothetical protein